MRKWASNWHKSLHNQSVKQLPLTPHHFSLPSLASLFSITNFTLVSASHPSPLPLYPLLSLFEFAFCMLQKRKKIPKIFLLTQHLRLFAATDFLPAKTPRHCAPPHCSLSALSCVKPLTPLCCHRCCWCSCTQKSAQLQLQLASVKAFKHVATQSHTHTVTLILSLSLLHTAAHKLTHQCNEDVFAYCTALSMASVLPLSPSFSLSAHSPSLHCSLMSFLNPHLALSYSAIIPACMLPPVAAVLPCVSFE